MHIDVYILIDLCSATVIISTGSTKFPRVAIFQFAYFQDGRQSLHSNLKMAYGLTTPNASPIETHV